MRPVSPTARKAGAALAALMLSTALTACQPDGSTDAAAPTATDQVSENNHMCAPKRSSCSL